MIGWAEARAGAPQAGIERLERALDQLLQSGALLMRPNFLSLLAEALTLDGRRTDALTALSEAQARSEQTGERYYLPEIHRQIGELLMGDAGSGSAEDRPIDEALDRAVAIAREQGSRSFALRALTTRARWWRQRRRGPEAARELGALLASFTEGFDTPDCRDAQAEIAAVGLAR
jgi:predicted ATPase